MYLTQNRFFRSYVQAWIELVVAIIWILSFSYYRPWWDFKYIAFISKRDLEKRIKANG